MKTSSRNVTEWVDFYFFKSFDTPKQMVIDVTIVTKPWSVKDFSRSGDSVLHVAENETHIIFNL